MQHTLDWNDLRYLLAVHETGSFARAARRLGVDPATAGRRMRALEDALGAPLLEGTPRNLSLTETGRRALAAAQRMDEATLTLERAALAAIPDVAGTLRITVTDALATRIVIPRLGELTARHPLLRLELVGGNETMNLSRREADIAVRLARPAEPALSARRVGTLAFAPYVSEAYVRRRGRRMDATLAGHVLLGYDLALARASAPLGWVDEVGGSGVLFRSTGTFAMLAAVKAGLGVGVIPCFVGDAERDLVRVRAGVRTRELWLVVHADVRRSRRTRAGLDFLASVIGEAGSLLAGEEPRR